MIATFPMNVAVGPGTLVWIFCNGWVVTWEKQGDLIPMIGYGSIISQIKHIFWHPVSYFGFGFMTFGLCLTPFANIWFAGGIAYGSGMLFTDFVNENVDGGDPLPTPGIYENVSNA